MQTPCRKVVTFVMRFRIVVYGRFLLVLYHLFEYTQLSGTDRYKTANCVDACNVD